MLAYLDDVLDPSDAEELGKKIEESDFAGGLVHRIRSSTRRIRLSSPSLEGKGVGLDANTVAEYLDNVLPPDRFPDFEKVCLESDVHLAEVACCHQILTLVLGEAAEVGPELRDRMYRIGAPDSDRLSGQESSEDRAAIGLSTEEEVDAPPAPSAPPVQTVSATDKSEPEIPAYLRVGQRSKAKPLAITLVLAFLISAVALRLMGPFNREHPLMRLFGAAESTQVADVESPGSTSGRADLAAKTPAVKMTITDTSPSNDEGGTAEDEVADTAKPVVPGEAGEGASSKEPSSANGSEKPDASAVDESAKPPKVAEGETASKMAVAKMDTEVDFPTTEPATPGGKPASSDPTGESDTSGKDVEGEPVAPAPPARIEVGYVRQSDQHFLVGLDPNSGAWHRLPGRTKLAADDRLRVLPTFRPEIVLTPGVQVVFAGPSFVRPLPPSEQGEPGLFIDFGRAFIATAGVAGARIHLDLGGHRGMATFVDAASEMAIEVRRYLPPGAHPEQETAQTVVRIFTTAGRIEWHEADSPTAVPIDAGQVRITIGGSSRTIAAGELPAWMRNEDLQDVDRSASTTLVGFLALDRPITLSLTERIEDRRSEVRSLASRCLAYLGTYEPLVKEFSDSRQRSYWAPEFGVLRHVISHSPENAIRLRETFEGSCGDDAVDLYRMVWGYSPEQLQEGADAKLVEFLDHESMQIRVFAYENLRRITNETHIYFPEATEVRRRSSVRKWREQLEDGAIIYDSLPTPVSGGS
jgi:hypothetical protein